MALLPSHPLTTSRLTLNPAANLCGRAALVFGRRPVIRRNQSGSDQDQQRCGEEQHARRNYFQRDCRTAFRMRHRAVCARQQEPPCKVCIAHRYSSGKNEVWRIFIIRKLHECCRLPRVAVKSGVTMSNNTPGKRENLSGKTLHRRQARVAEQPW